MRRFVVNGELFEVDVRELTRDRAVFLLNGRTYCITPEIAVPDTHAATSPLSRQWHPQSKGAAGMIAVAAPMPGVVVALECAVGASVTHGDTLIRIEAMKMQNLVSSPVSGVVTELAVTVGQEVNDGEVLLLVKRSEG